MCDIIVDIHIDDNRNLVINMDRIFSKLTLQWNPFVYLSIHVHWTNHTPSYQPLTDALYIHTHTQIFKPNTKHYCGFAVHLGFAHKLTFPYIQPNGSTRNTWPAYISSHSAFCPIQVIPWELEIRQIIRLSVRRAQPQPFPWPVRPFRRTVTYSKLHVNVFGRVRLWGTLAICCDCYVFVYGGWRGTFDRRTDGRADHTPTPHKWMISAAMAAAIWWTDGLSRGRPVLWWCKLKFQNLLGPPSWTEASVQSVQCVFRFARIPHIGDGLRSRRCGSVCWGW